MPTRFNPNFGRHIQVYTLSTRQPKYVGIKSCRHAGGVSFAYGCSYPAAIVFDQTHVISIGKIGCRVVHSCLLDG